MAEFLKEVKVNNTQRVLFLGDESIGKTTFIEAMCELMRNSHNCEIMTGSYLVFSQYVFDTEVRNMQIPFQLLDLPAGTTVETRRDQYPVKINLIVLCFAVDNPTSFANVTAIWRPEYRRYYPVHSTRFFLLGLRNDLREDPETRQQLLMEHGEPVTVQNARRLHEEYEFCGSYMECSTRKNPEELRNVVNILLRQVSFTSE